MQKQHWETIFNVCGLSKFSLFARILFPGQFVGKGNPWALAPYNDESPTSSTHGIGVSGLF